jgi:hypothetical protein
MTSRMTKNSPEQSENPSDKDSETSSSSPQPSQDVPRLKSGAPINLNGRPKGSRNRITAQKLGIEEALRDQLNLEMPEVLLKAIELAKKGDRTMIKLLVEMTMSKPQAVEDESSGKEKIQITVRKLNLELPKPDPTLIEGKVIDEQSETEDGR